MEKPEELLQIGGPIILEKLPQNRDMNVSEESPQLPVSECFKLISAKASLKDARIKGTIPLCCTDVNATCCLEIPSKTRSSTQPPDGDYRDAVGDDNWQSCAGLVDGTSYMISH